MGGAGLAALPSCVGRAAAPQSLPNASRRCLLRPRAAAPTSSADEEWGGGDSGGQAKGWDPARYQALLRGGQEVVCVLEDMIKVLEDVTGMDRDSENTAIHMAAVAAVGQRLGTLDGSFLAALDLMIRQSLRDNDGQRKELLQVIKETTLAQITEKTSPEVQVVALLCQTPDKEHRRHILRSAAAGGGVYGAKGGGKVKVPGASMQNVAAQASDIIVSMEEKARLVDRRLLAKLVLVREEAHDMLGGGVLDERNKSPLQNLALPEVDLIAKLVAQRPSPSLRGQLADVFRGMNEGADIPQDGDKQGRIGPVRPGMFVESVTKLLDGMYDSGSAAGVTLQHLDWVYKTSLDVLQEIAFQNSSEDTSI